MRMLSARVRSFGAAIVLVAGWVVAPALPASSTPSWSFVMSPNPQGADAHTALSSVVCITTTNCVAVGDSLRVVSLSTSITTTLVERWDGKSWSIVPSPSPGMHSSLVAVSCTGPGFCLAVGGRADGTPVASITTVAEMWNGAKWSIVPSANRAGYISSLGAVSCRTSRDCVAVGSYSSQSDVVGSLVEHWNGKTLSVEPSTSARVARDSCTTASGRACVAVGGGGDGRLFEQWNGRSWLVVSTPRAPIGGQPQAVKCISKAWCVAVGETNDGKSFIEHWDGAAWSIMPSPNRASQLENGLSAVKCLSTSDCTAVGGPSEFSKYPGNRLIQHWDGAKWSIVTNPVPASIEYSALADVSCPTHGGCVAVGYFMFSRSRYEKTLVMRQS